MKKINPIHNPLKRVRYGNELKNHFLSYKSINKLTDCWDWLLSLDLKGYGNFHYNNKYFKAHRFAYELFVKEIPNGLWVLHKCDNRKCVNPDHLFLGTALDNAKDRDQKKRGHSGEKHYFSKLTDNQRSEIINRCIYNKEKCSKVALDYNITSRHAYHIVKKYKDFMQCNEFKEPIKIVRNGLPNCYDLAPYLSTCYSTQEDKIYIQMSKEEDQPNWVLKE